MPVAAVQVAWFENPHSRDRAYENVALPIGCGQTISQPLVVARMLYALAPQPEGGSTGSQHSSRRTESPSLA